MDVWTLVTQQLFAWPRHILCRTTLLYKVVWLNCCPCGRTFTLKLLGINHLLVFRTVKQYNEVGDIVDRLREGHPHSVHLPSVIHADCKCVRQNPLHKQKRMAVEISVSTQSMSHILHNSLKLRAFRCCVSHTLTCKLREIHRTHCAALWKRFKGMKYRNILFIDENIFSIQEKLNHQNDRVYAQSCCKSREKMARVTHLYHPRSVMVWLSLTKECWKK